MRRLLVAATFAFFFTSCNFTSCNRGRERSAVDGVVKSAAHAHLIEDVIERDGGEMEVWLGGAVDKLVGHQWPKEGDEYADSCGLDRPVHLAVRLPSGKKLTVWSKYVLLSQEEGIVTMVVVNPCPVPCKFREAIDAVEKFGRNVVLEDGPAYFAELQRWREVVKPPLINHNLTAILEERVTLFVQLACPGLDADGEWLCSLDLNYLADQNLWELYKKK